MQQRKSKQPINPEIEERRPSTGDGQEKPVPDKTTPEPQISDKPVSELSGMYTFLEEGEYLQLTVENDSPRPPRVTGFISRYGQDESDKGIFLDHFFSKGSLDGEKIAFTTRQVHGIRFEFSGRITHDPLKKRAQQGYNLVSGTLTQYTTDISGKVQAKTRSVTFKSFPQLEDDVGNATR